MSECEAKVYAEEYYDLLIDYNRVENFLIPECMQRISEILDVGYYYGTGMPALDVQEYTYTSIPNCFSLTDISALDASNILILQNQPTLNLKGQGVMVGFVDTGIAYQNPLFRNNDGSTRIAAIWDQTLAGGRHPEGFLYGTLFEQDELDAALRAEEPLRLVPTEDRNGHGTFLAGIAAGGEDPGANYIGAVPEATIVVVKCKEAKQNIRSYYCISENAVCYQENDILAGVSFLHQFAEQKGMPLVICIAMGTNMGSHAGNSPLSVYLNGIGARRGRAITIAAGNEANMRHHYYGQNMSQGSVDNVEISVGEGVEGFTMELWAAASELYQVGILSPTGELYQPVTGVGAQSGEHLFYFENTRVMISYAVVQGSSASQIIFIRFQQPLQGIWTLRVTARRVIRGEYHIWLPLQAFLTGNVFFLRSNPDVTATVPSYTPSAVSVGAYHASNSILYPDSGRGYSADQAIKPDLAAPGVDVKGPLPAGGYTTRTGTSVSAAITAGACTQLLQWGIVQRNNITLNSAQIGAILIRGARRNAERSYPNREWGYGALDVYEALNRLRDI